MTDRSNLENQPVRAGGRMAASIHDIVKERLVSGEYAAGSKLSVETIRSEFEVSKQPVMEALRLLSGDGLVEIIPQVGCVVASYPLQEVADFYQMFAGFEGAIAEAAARRRSSGQLERLAEVSGQIGQLRTTTDAAVRASQYRLLNRAFHQTIHTMSGSRIMAETSRRMWDLSDFLINTTGVQQPLSSAITARHDDHEKIRLALEQGDAAKARREMERHIYETVDVIHAEVATEEQTP